MSRKQKGGRQAAQKKDPRKENLEQGMLLCQNSPLFSRLGGRLHLDDRRTVGNGGAAVVTREGIIFLNQEVLLSPGQWAYVIAHCRLHLAFGHFDGERMPEELRASGLSMQRASTGVQRTSTGAQRTSMGVQGNTAENRRLWNLACDIYVTKFLADMKFGVPLWESPEAVFPGSLTDEQKIYRYLKDNLEMPWCRAAVERGYGTALPGGMDMRGLENPLYYDSKKKEYNLYARQFACALTDAVSRAVEKAGGHAGDGKTRLTRSQKAAQWFLNHYPLLGGIAATFTIIEDEFRCRQEEIRVAAVNVELGEIYVNPAAGLDGEELKFVLAHEFLHAGLGHGERCRGREQEYWNAACDYVINGWLAEMGIGRMPQIGILYDEGLKNRSAEEVYDCIVGNIRKYSGMETLRGYGKGDILSGNGKGSGSSKHAADGRDAGDGPQGGTGWCVSLDEYCRSALLQGLEFHQTAGRGTIPAGLEAEIRALAMPPIPWDVELARWFDEYFPFLEKRRTYARPSRRQGAVPDIPRPRYVAKDAMEEGRTFGVVVDTSGSMNAVLLGKALGSIASYGAAREVPFVRVIFCDAAAYDAGYLRPEDITGRVVIKGRGGTRLQPAVNLLESAKDFPKNGPILIITDGFIEDDLTVRRNHAFLVPRGRRLPCRVKGRIFYLE